MAYEGFCDLFSKEEKTKSVDFHSFTKILIVSFATSLDAFGVGIGLGISGKPITLYIISIGFWAFTSTIVGLNLARVISKKSGPIVTLLGSIVLGIVAFQMLKI